MDHCWSVHVCFLIWCVYFAVEIHICVCSPVTSCGILNISAQSTMRGNASTPWLWGLKPLPPQSPQSSSTHLSIEDQLIDLWPLISSRELNWLTSSTWTAYSVSLSLQTHTQTTSICVCDSVIDPWKIFPPFFCSSLYCMDDPSYCDKVFQKRF